MLNCFSSYTSTVQGQAHLFRIQMASSQAQDWEPVCKPFFYVQTPNLSGPSLVFCN
jgi:hypothetical protein